MIAKVSKRKSYHGIFCGKFFPHKLWALSNSELHCKGMFSVLAATGEQLDDVRQWHASDWLLNREIASVDMTNDWL